MEPIHYATFVQDSSDVCPMVRFQAVDEPATIDELEYHHINNTKFDHVVHLGNERYIIVCVSDDQGESWTHGEYYSVDEVDEAIEKLLDL